MYEVFEHTADLGLRVRAGSRDELFVEAAHALFAVVVANPAAVRTVEHRTIHISGGQLDYLFFDWLNELLYLLETQHLLLVQFEVACTDEGLSATCSGETIDPARHVLEHEVKAITYHELKVGRDGEDWVAEVIVDI
jgi:SHS2 domain-containing protein